MIRTDTHRVQLCPDGLKLVPDYAASRAYARDLERRERANAARRSGFAVALPAYGLSLLRSLRKVASLTRRAA